MELRDYLRVLRVHWLSVLAAVACGLALAAGWTFLQPRVYTAEASGYVAAAAEDNIGSSMVGNQLAQSKVRSYVEVGSWRTVAEYAIGALGLDATPEAVVGRVNVTNPTDTVVLRVSAKGSSPEEARDLAEAWIRGMIAEIEKIEQATGGVEPAVRLVAGDSARLPGAPSSPNVRVNLALGLLLGLMVGMGYALVREWLDRRIRSAEGVEDATGLSVIGGIPLDHEQAATGRALRATDGARSDRDADVQAEAFRMLRTNLQYMQVDDPPRAIVITSALPGDGKSFVASKLAMALAQAGQSTVLVDADMRRPRIASMFGLDAEVGLSDVVAGRAEVGDIRQPGPGLSTRQVLTSGPIPPNPSELLGSERMHRLVDAMKAGSFVVIDAPPLLPVTDAAVLTHRTDGALVVIDTGKTTYEALDRALDALAKANGKALGVVMNRVPRSGAGAVYYGYQYTDSYYQAEPARSVPGGRRVAR